jgi:1,4-alpha-glucan branching enzyme
MKRALQQAARNILLAQSSDWPFIMKTGTNRSYARKRVQDHLARFYCLREMIERNRIDRETLTALEQLDTIFPQIDVSLFTDT